MKNLIHIVIYSLFIVSLSACSFETDSHEHDDTHHEELVTATGDGTEDVHSDEEDNVISLSEKEIMDTGIKISQVEKASFMDVLELPAEIRFDENNVAHVHSRIGGAVTKLNASEGDVVQKGQRLAVIASRDLAHLKQNYFSTKAKEALAETTLKRERALWDEKITSLSDLQQKEAAFEVAKIERISAENKLIAAGLTRTSVRELDIKKENSSSELIIRAPISGIVVQRNTVLGDTVSATEGSATRMFTIVDKSIVWADIAIYKKDLSNLKTGASVRLYTDKNVHLATSEIAMILPVFDEVSRTAKARAIVNNNEQILTPGQFLRAKISTGETKDHLTVKTDSVQTIDGKSVVFIVDDEGFVPREITLGKKEGDKQAVLSGLDAHDRYVSEGAFVLKAELEKAAFGDGHGH